MPNERLAQTYAQALFAEAMANWIAPLRVIAKSLSRTSVVEQLDSPGLDLSKKQDLLRSALPSNAPKELLNLAQLLASKNQVYLLPQIAAEFDKFSERSAPGRFAHITSAVALASSEKDALEVKLRSQFGSDLVFEYSVNPAILGGITVRVGDKVIDGSVAGKLAELKEQLK